MPLRNRKSYRIKPTTVADTLDGTNSSPGSMQSLQNLIYDPSTPNCFVPRTAATVVSSFPGFTSPGVVSAAFIINGNVYGMVASGLVAGYDQPFCYNIASNVFYTVSGTQTSATLPATQSTSGAWTPPTMDASGVIIVVTHPGFTGGTNPFFGWFDITSPNAPVWHAGNTTTNLLPAVPTAVCQFNTRFYFLINNTTWYTNTFSLTITNASQSLTYGDIEVCTALVPFSLNTTTQGVLQALLVFKRNAIFQVTGDSALSTLAVNALPNSVGCIAPRSIAPTPLGVFFIAPDGLRRVRLDGYITEADENIRVPFINAVSPSRISAAYGQGIYRICVQNNNVAATTKPYQEYWFDESHKGWTGPHTFRQDLALPYLGNFICFDSSHPGQIYQSNTSTTGLSTYIENGSQLVFFFWTPPLPDDGDLNANSTMQSTINMQIPSGTLSVGCIAYDDIGTILGSTQILTPYFGGSTWGLSIWGAFLWGGSSTGLQPHTIPWTNQLVFNKLSVLIEGVSANGFRISNFQTTYQPLGYVLT